MKYVYGIIFIVVLFSVPLLTVPKV